jgi:hypothetical protein
MKQTILDFTTRLTLTDLTTSGALSIAGLCSGNTGSDRDTFDCLVLDEAIHSSLVEIVEAGEGGHVPELLVENRSDRRVFMMDGEQLIGAKQNRILNTSIVVDSHATVRIPVSCMEQGRWHSSSRTMDAGEITNPGLRGAKAAQVSENLVSRRSFAADQGAIWNSVHTMIEQHTVEAPTRDFDRVYRHVRSDLDRYVDELPYVTGALGVVAFIGDRLACADVFDSTDTCRKLWKKLISSYALDAMDRGPKAVPSPEDCESAVRELLRSPRTARLSTFESPGLGTDVRIDGELSRGAALIVDNRVIHLALFRDEPVKDPDWTPITRPSRRAR